MMSWSSTIEALPEPVCTLQDCIAPTMLMTISRLWHLCTKSTASHTTDKPLLSAYLLAPIRLLTSWHMSVVKLLSQLLVSCALAVTWMFVLMSLKSQSIGSIGTGLLTSLLTCICSTRICCKNIIVKNSTSTWLKPWGPWDGNHLLEIMMRLSSVLTGNMRMPMCITKSHQSRQLFTKSKSLLYSWIR